MMKRLPVRWAALAAASILAAVGCQSTRAPDTAHAEKSSSEAGSDRVTPEARAPVGAFQPVYFDLDRWELRKDSRQRLKASAEQIQARPGWGVLTIEGHCDERGSEEYNLALGERRAGAVKRYLVDLGMPASNLETVSYGESRPAAVGHDERVWSLNRRAEIRIESRQASR
jgi:peptidoglycan-associated lipoprotein